MPAEYQRHQERPEVANRARLAQAARVILKDVTTQGVDFGWAAGILMGTPNEDAAILQMIEYGRRLHEMGEDIVFREIEKQSGMRVDILNPHAKFEFERNKSGFLVALEGIGQEDVTGTGMPILKGRAIVRDYQGLDAFIHVGIAENGTVFVITQEPIEK